MICCQVADMREQDQFDSDHAINTDVAALRFALDKQNRELQDALDRQAATADILEVISSSATNTQLVFEAIVRAGSKLFPDAAVSVALPRDGQVHAVAVAETDPQRAEAWRTRFPFPLAPEYMHGAAILDGRVIDIPDVMNAPAQMSIGAKNFLISGYRAVTIMPMLRAGEAIGVISVVRVAAGPLSTEQVSMLRTFAAQAVIAIDNAEILGQLRKRTLALEDSYQLVQSQAHQLEAQSNELIKLNENLEHRVSEQVAEIERYGRLRRFLPPQVADLIISSDGEEKLNSHRSEVTALFCDIRGFTAFAESADPEDVIKLLQEYHVAVGQKIQQYGGTLERFVGDGVMAIFNDPIPVDRPASQAVRMALSLRRELSELVLKWQRMGHDLGFGIGISQGFATMGIIGFEGRLDYAAIGTVSNVASRLCGQAAAGEILISGRVFVAVENEVTVEPRGELSVKGMRRPLAAYAVIGFAE
jgi:class 3 adenylate cyclase